MTTKEKHPSYFLRRKDFKPISGIVGYRDRCWFEKISHDTEDGYDFEVTKGKALLALYNTVVFGAVSFGVFMGITKGLELIVK